MGVSDDKIFPLSTPSKPCSKLTSSVEAKENRLTSPDLANLKKSSSKNFMSPTISAASKAVVHRKKVLAERNGGEATEPTYAKLLHRRSTSFDLKQQGSVDMSAAVYNSTDSLSSRVKEMNGAGDAEDGDKSKPYDPVFNYCSPRPKFLLYKPDRRSEILRRYEMVDSTSSESETGSENGEPLVRPDEEVPENAGEFADNDDDRKAEETAAQPDERADAKFEKHVEEIHQAIDEPVHENAGEFADHDDDHKAEETTAQPDEGADEKAEKHVEEVHQRIDEPVHEAELAKLPTPESGSPKLKNETSETKSDALGTEEDDESQIQSMEIEEEEGELKEHWSLKRLLKLWFVIVVLGLSTLYVSSMKSPSVGLEDEHWMAHSGLRGAPFTHENASGSVIQCEMAKMGFEEASLRIMDEIIVGDHDDDTADGNHEVKYEESQAESTADPIATENGMDSELSEVVHYAAGEKVAEDAGNIADEELVYVEPEDHDAVNEVGEPQSEASEASMDGSADANDHAEVTLEGTVVFQDSTGEELEAGDREVVDSSEALTESGDDETQSNLEEAEASEVDSAHDLVDEPTPIYTKGSDKALIFSVASALLLAFLGGLWFQKLKRNTKPPTKESAGVPRPDANIGQHQVKQVDPSEYPSLSQSFKNEAGAPRVELLGEFSIGEDEVSSYSLRTNCIENHEQRNLKMSAKQTWTTPADSHPAASGFSSTTDSPPHGSYSSQRRSTRKELPTSSIDSPSYGSFTTELMLRKKEEAPGSDKVVVTPVRRSSRIRGRMTPGASS